MYVSLLVPESQVDWGAPGSAFSHATGLAHVAALACGPGTRASSAPTRIAATGTESSLVSRRGLSCSQRTRRGRRADRFEARLLIINNPPAPTVTVSGCRCLVLELKAQVLAFGLISDKI